MNKFNSGHITKEEASTHTHTHTHTNCATFNQGERYLHVMVRILSDSTQSS